MSTTNEIRGVAARSAELVTYQSGSIVSRVLLKTPCGSITAFAFDRGQELSEHTAPFDALVQVVEGTAEIRVSDSRHRLKAGELIILPANEPHAVTALSAFKMILSMLKV